MRKCPHCGALVADDDLITCPKCKANLNTYYKDNEVYYKSNKFETKKAEPKSEDNKEKPKKNNEKNSLKVKNCLSAENTAKIKKYWWIFPVAILYIILIIAIIFFASSVNTSEYTSLSFDNNSQNNTASYCDNVFVALPDDEVDKKVSTIEYNEQTDEYCIKYKTLPEFFSDKAIGDIFVVEADEDSKIDAFNLGFSGVITDIHQENKNSYVKFVIPDFTQLFDSCSISTLESSNVTNVKFYPSQEYEIKQYVVPMSVSKRADEISFGNFTAGYTYKKADKESELAGYELLAKKLKLEIKHKSDVDDNEIELSGDITFDYPAVKFSLDYDNTDGEPTVNNYDVGFISKEKANVKIKAKGNAGADVPDDWIEELRILDYSDATDEEKGKVVLGTYVIGYNVPSVILHNNKNNVSYLSLGISVQVAVTLNGEIELEYGVEQSGFIDVSDSSDGESHCRISNYKYPNPVIGEVQFDEDANLDFPEIKTSCKGSIDMKMAVGVDVGFCIYACIPIKVSTDFVCLEFIRNIEDESKMKMTPISENGEMKTVEDVSFYQFKSQSNLILNFGGKYKIGVVKYEIGKVSMRKMLFSKVWDQYPQPVDFDSSQFDFGNIMLGLKYSKDDMNTLFYNDLKGRDKSYLTGKLKDKFIQSTTESVSDKINVDFNDLFEFAQLDEENYDIVCYSEGAIYLTNQGIVKAQIISGKDVENCSHVSCGMSRKMVKQIYSDPSDEQYINIEFGDIMVEFIKAVGMDELLRFNGMKVTADVYKSSDSDNEMLMIFDGSDKLVLVVCK